MYYFAYGSNMNWQQMTRRCPSARFVAIARLPGHRFAITRRSRRRLCGTADVVPDVAGEVWGIVYELDDSELSVLDGFEDGYNRERKWVYPSSNGDKPIEVLLYVAEKEPNPPLPDAEYKRLMVEGARHWKLPQVYLKMLEKLQAEEEKDKR